jgi:hypothetical protein
MMIIHSNIILLGKRIEAQWERDWRIGAGKMESLRIIVQRGLGKLFGRSDLILKRKSSNHGL